MTAPSQAPAIREEYPAAWPSRILAGVLVGGCGYGIWGVAMMMTASHVGGRPWDSSLGLFHLGLPVMMLFGVVTIGEPPGVGPIIGLLYILYFIAMLGSWTLIFARMESGLWFWRIVSVGFGLPFVVLIEQYLSLGSRGIGALDHACDVWAVGSFLIGLSVWIFPPRVPGELSDTLTVLWRIHKGRSVFQGEGPSAEGTFPVVGEEEKVGDE